MAGQRILITGISRFLGGRLAQRLEQDPDVHSIIGVDLEEPSVELTRTEYVRADIRNPLIVKVLQAAEVDTVGYVNPCLAMQAAVIRVCSDKILPDSCAPAAYCLAVAGK